MNRQPKCQEVRQPQGIRPAATQSCRLTRRGSGRPNDAADDAPIALAGGGLMNGSGGPAMERVSDLRRVAQAGKDTDPAGYRIHRRLSIYLTWWLLRLGVS